MDNKLNMGNALKCMQHHIVIKHYCELPSYLNTDFVYMDYMEITSGDGHPNEGADSRSEVMWGW